jgi:hypothetical protein
MTGSPVDMWTVSQLLDGAGSNALSRARLRNSQSSLPQCQKSIFRRRRCLEMRMHSSNPKRRLT